MKNFLAGLCINRRKQREKWLLVLILITFFNKKTVLILIMYMPSNQLSKELHLFQISLAILKMNLTFVTTMKVMVKMIFSNLKQILIPFLMKLN